MNVVVIEDEPLARQWVAEALRQCDVGAVIQAELDSVETTVAWFQEHAAPDLVISDIELSDGNVFAALQRCPVECPIIFLTAYDQFVLRAFDDNGIAYLLKPVDLDKFAAAIDKYQRLRRTFCGVPTAVVDQLRRAIATPNWRERLVVKRRDGIRLLPTEAIAYIQTRDEITSAYDRAGQEFPLRETLKELEGLLDPASFHRVNRSQIVNVAAIERLEALGAERLLIRLRNLDATLTTSAARTPAIRRWLAR